MPVSTEQPVRSTLAIHISYNVDRETYCKGAMVVLRLTHYSMIGKQANMAVNQKIAAQWISTQVPINVEYNTVTEPNI
jgi:hypothetical protein